MKRALSFLGTLFFTMVVMTGQPLVFVQDPEPTVPSSDAHQSLLNCRDLKVDFDAGNGDRRLIVMRAGAPVDQLPQDGLEYTANGNFGSGDDLGNGNFAVYKGTSSKVTITGLQEKVNYHYAIFEYNGTGTNTNYLTSIYLSLNIQLGLDPRVTIDSQMISCYRAADGSITLDVAEGTEPYEYNWSTGASSNAINSLAPGNYAFTVTDSVGCTVSDEVTITQPDSISIAFETEDVSCHDGADGSIKVLPSGGVGGFSYEWSANGLSGDSVGGLSIGNYEVTVTDSNGCTAHKNIAINQPEPLQLEQSVTNATCHDSEDGRIQLSPSGATPPYAITWETGDSTFTLENITAGNYAYTITDANECENTGDVNVGSPEPLGLEAEIYDITCHGANDGIINLDLAGGTKPYSLQWSDGGEGVERSDLSAGNYTAYVTDKNGCSDTLTVTIYEPDSLHLDWEVTDASCEAIHDGTIDVTMEGGTAPYSYQWTDGSTSEDRAYLETGSYALTVTDDNGCTISGNPVVGVAPNAQEDCSIDINIHDIFTPNGDGTNDDWIVEDIQAYPDNQLEIYNRWGTLVYQTQGYQNNWDGTNNAGEELPPGTYYYVLKIFTASANTFTGSITFLR